jgi:hypothetical protein
MSYSSYLKPGYHSTLKLTIRHTSCSIRHRFPVFFVVIVVIAIIEVCPSYTRIQRYDNPFAQLSISAWLTSRYNSRHNFLTTTERDRVRFLLFCSIWTTLLSPIFPVMLSLESLEVLSSVAAHLALFVSLIIPLISLMICSTTACSYRGCSGSQGQRLSHSLLMGALTAGTLQVPIYRLYSPPCAKPSHCLLWPAERT